MVKEMACPSDENSGFIQITDPITISNLNAIVVDSYPFTISFAPRTVVPTLSGNQIIESNATENTCTYQGNRFQLINIQLCSVLHKGYTLPSQNMVPEMELILTFKGGSSNTNLYAGMIISIPIYQANNPRRSEYITQILNQSSPSCKYTNQPGFEYGGDSYQTLQNSNLNSCIQTCCNDVNCLSYNFNKGTCSLKKSIENIKNTGDSNMIAGRVDHSILNPSGSCSVASTGQPNKNANVNTLESIFYSDDGTQQQTSFSYKTCFEVIDAENNISSKNIAVFVFPYGIQLTGATIELLKLQLSYKLPVYSIPGEIRDDKSTMLTYRLNSLGDKTFDRIDLSKVGNVYTTKISSCSNEFKNRFEYFTSSPRLPKTSNGNTSTITSLDSNQESALSSNGSTSYYQTNQYKCVPFNQLSDLSGKYVIPGNKTLESVLDEQKIVQEKQNKGDSSTKSITTDEIETYVAAAIGGTIALAFFIRFGIWLSKRA